MDILLLESPTARKRTSSFSYPIDTPAFAPSPRPAKVPRMGSSLRRTESMVVLPEMHQNQPAATPLPYYRTLQYYKEQRLRRKAVLNPSSITIREVAPTQPAARQTPQQPQPWALPSSSAAKSSQHRRSLAATTKRAVATPKAPSQVILPSLSSPITVVRTHRTSSPLSPVRTVLPGRPVFPRSKAEPDLYRTAIKARMLASPEGQRILHLGPRLALSIMNATQDIIAVTRDLERIVADQQERDKDNDVVMTDATPALTSSWVMVKGEDWEMVDCGA